MTPTLPSHEQRLSKRAAKLLKRNDKIRELFYTRFTNQPRPRIYTREGIIAKLAEEFYLSMDRIEDIIYEKNK